MATVLLASLGESPAVVTAMYDLLTKKKGIAIDVVDVLYPTGRYVKDSYRLVKDEFSNDILRSCELPFEDANSESDAINFLKELYHRLDEYQANGDVVYLSLAGGRKSMAALMAWVAPFFSCIQKLCHVVDPQKESFPSIEEMILEMDDAQRRQAMHPNLDQLRLVEIPFGEGQRISRGLHEELLSSSADDQVFTRVEEEAADFLKGVDSEENALPVRLTKRAAEQYLELYKNDPHHARGFEICFERMRFASMVRSRVRDHVNDKQSKVIPVPLHFFKRKRSETVERPVFYTSPRDIKHCADHEIKEVVVCELEIKKSGRYRSLKEITSSPNFSWKPAILAEALPSVKYAGSDECILIVPLGQAPMIATQLYTLLTERERLKIKEIVLIYPEDQTIIAGAELVKKELHDHKGVPCKQARISGLKDITSKEDCQKYQKKLEDEIEGALKKVDSKQQQIILALSGGRKGMTAMTIFAAQKKHIPYVYHTLIIDPKLSDDLEKKAKASDLRKLSKQDLNERLFLGKYKGDGEGPYPDFAIFRVPVFSTAN